jgi:CRP/FNR family cyclic AMP-dependent transcriptional regulator
MKPEKGSSAPLAGSAPSNADAAVQAPADRLRQAGLAPVTGDDLLHADVARMVSAMPLFAGLDASEIGALCQRMQLFDAQAGDTLINEGEPGDFMLLVLTGSVDVLRRNRYNYPSRIAVAAAGQALGEMSMFDGEPRFASCVALEPTRVAILERDAMMALLDAQPTLGKQVLLRLAQLLSERLRQASAQLVVYVEAARQA